MPFSLTYSLDGRSKLRREYCLHHCHASGTNSYDSFTSSLLRLVVAALNADYQDS